MKKTRKERLYDFSVWFFKKNILLLFCVLALACLVCSIVSYVIFECELLAGILMSSFGILPPLVLVLSVFLAPIKSYNKETFMSNKVRNLLFADDSFVLVMMVWCLYIAFALITYVFIANDIKEKILIIGCIPIGIVGAVCKKQISKHFKRKIVYVETDVNNLKV